MQQKTAARARTAITFAVTALIVVSEFAFLMMVNHLGDDVARRQTAQARVTGALETWQPGSDTTPVATAVRAFAATGAPEAARLQAATSTWTKFPTPTAEARLRAANLQRRERPAGRPPRGGAPHRADPRDPPARRLGRLVPLVPPAGTTPPAAAARRHRATGTRLQRATAAGPGAEQRRPRRRARAGRDRFLRQPVGLLRPGDLAGGADRLPLRRPAAARRRPAVHQAAGLVAGGRADRDAPDAARRRPRPDGRRHAEQPAGRRDDRRLGAHRP